MPSTLASLSGTSVGINSYLKSQTAECICEQHFLGRRALPDNALITVRDFTYLMSQPAAQRENFVEYPPMAEAAEAALEVT